MLDVNRSIARMLGPASDRSRRNPPRTGAVRTPRLLT
jgi:hypothetical protein